MQVYDRFWSNEEIRGNGELAEGLRRELTLFRFRSGPVDATAHGGVLSLKGVMSGRVSYDLGSRTFETAPNRILMVPADAFYRTRVGDAGATILCFYFPTALAAQAYDRVVYGDAPLLDQPDRELSLPFPPHLRSVSPAMAARFGLVTRALSRSQLQSAAFDVLDAFVASTLEASRQWTRAPAAKANVRRELFRRASTARDMIEDNLHRVVPLAELAATACLSPFHPHRVFTGVFGETPFEMSRRRRLETARTLLAAGRTSIERVAAAVGFENGPAFSRAFRAACGVSPREYRRARGQALPVDVGDERQTAALSRKVSSQPS